MAFLSNYFRKRAEKKQNRKALEAAVHGDFKTALQMIDEGVDINLTDRMPRYAYAPYKVSTSFGYAAIDNKNIKALKALFSRNLDANQLVSEEPLLMHALEHHEEKMAEMLLDRGARTDYIRGDLETPLSLAKRAGYAGVISRIVNKRTAEASANSNP